MANKQPFCKKLLAYAIYHICLLKSIRSKMSIRAEERPKAFEAQFLSTSEVVSEFGNFNVKPGEIVSEHFYITGIEQCEDNSREDNRVTNYATITLFEV